MSPREDLKFIGIIFNNGGLKSTLLKDLFGKFFVEFARTKINSFAGSRFQQNIRVICKRLSPNGFSLLIHTGEYYEDLILELRAYDNTDVPFSVYEINNNLNNYLMNHLESKNDDSIYTKINEILNEMYKDLQNTTPKQTETKSQNIQTNSPKQEVQQPTKPVIEPTVQVVTPAISPQEFYSKEFTVKHLEYYIPNEFRELVKKYGVEGNKTNILRCIDLTTKIRAVMLRKSKTKSVLRINRSDNAKLTLKIGTGDRLITNVISKFEWREPHTEENIQHIKDAFIELNKWYKEKKELFEKEKIEEELKKKETETKLIEDLEKGEFKPLE